MNRPILTGTTLAWLLLFPSLGIVSKYLGTAAAVAGFGLGLLVFAALAARGVPARLSVDRRDGRWASATIVALWAALAAGFLILYPIVNVHASTGALTGLVNGGSDRDESLALGVSALLAGRNPYLQVTYLDNRVTQLPGSLLMTVPFAMIGNAVWQNLFWLAALFGVTRYLLGRDRLAIGLLTVMVLGNPAVLHDLVTGGDLGVNAIAILIGMLAIVIRAADGSVARWQTIGAAVFTGIALSSRLNYLLLVPPLFAAVARRVSVREASIRVLAVGLAFGAVTLPFYWHDPAGFAPLHLHNKFQMFNETIPNSGILFPAVCAAFSVMVAVYPANRTASVWLMQSGLVLLLPVVCLVALATLRAHALTFASTDYAIPAVFFGGMGTGLAAVASEFT